MINRCLNPNDSRYERYKTIKIHPSWVKSFWQFLADVGPRPSKEHTIDRIDNEGDYTPKNCRWASRKEQQRNKRDNLNISFDGRTQTLAEWVEETGIPRGTINWRLKNGWSAEKALTRGRYQRSFSDEDEQEIRKRAAEGEFPASIAKDFGVSRLTVWRFLTGKKSR
jgi:DNA invertase Pin-like site-specific DNA recombinase